MSNKRYEWLLEQVKASKWANFVEIGTWTGETGQKIIEQCKADERKYLGFDLFEDFVNLAEQEFCPKKPSTHRRVENRFKNLKMRLSTYGINLKYKIVKGNTRETLKTNFNYKADMIWLDGGHSLTTVASDFYLCEQFLKPNTVIFMDDFYHDDFISDKYGCAQLAKTLKTKPNYSVKLVGPIDRPNGGTQIVKVRKLTNG